MNSSKMGEKWFQNEPKNIKTDENKDNATKMDDRM